MSVKHIVFETRQEDGYARSGYDMVKAGLPEPQSLCPRRGDYIGWLRCKQKNLDNPRVWGLSTLVILLGVSYSTFKETKREPKSYHRIWKLNRDSLKSERLNN